MLHIEQNSIKIRRAKKAFHKGMMDFIFKRIDKIKAIKNVDTELIETYFDLFINEHIDDILIGDPEKLIEINDKIKHCIGSNESLRKGIEYVFNYDSFIKKKKNTYDGYSLAESLEINTCIYCNRNYTNTIIQDNGEKLTRPQFDHYFDKASNPLLAVSFYNLIPSCYVCNSSIKGTAVMDLNDYLHPYIDNKIDDIRFTYRYSHKTKSGLKVIILSPNHSKAQKTIELFALEQIYNSHVDELLDLIKIRQYFSDKYLSILSSSLLKNVIVSKEDIYRIVFGTEFNSINFVNRPFSKFKSDILRELGIIN